MASSRRAGPEILRFGRASCQRAVIGAPQNGETELESHERCLHLTYRCPRQSCDAGPSPRADKTVRRSKSVVKTAAPAPKTAPASSPRSQRFLARTITAFSSTTGLSPHSLPVASIPPFAPPEQGEKLPTSTLEVLTGATGAAATLGNRLVPCATTAGLAVAADTFAVRPVRASTGFDGSTRPIFAVACGDDTTVKASASTALPHWLPVASVPPPLPPEHSCAYTGLTNAIAAIRHNIRIAFIRTSDVISSREVIPGQSSS